MHVGKFFCYLVKAFDRVNHDILFSELHVYSIQGIAAELYQILFNRQKTRGRNKTMQ
jgi:chromosome condensin MukBEF MukE localization factor